VIIFAGKDIENRIWPTKLRGMVAIHASKGLTRKQFEKMIEVWLRAKRSPSHRAGLLFWRTRILECA
jgi:hypothetical protein